MLQIQKFMQEHNNWAELLAAEPYNLKISYDGNLVMFKYNQLTADFHLPIVCEARGIIFENKYPYRRVCHAFDKFFNSHEELAATIDWNHAFVTEKVDGSLMKVFWYNDEWHLATNGTINAFNAELGDGKDFASYGDLWEFAWPAWRGEFECHADENCTYYFELVSPHNRMTIYYPETKIYFLGWRDMVTDNEISFTYSYFDEYCATPKVYSLTSLADVEAAAETLEGQEGFVVCDAEFNRVKVKSPQYLMMSYMHNNGIMTTRRYLEMILAHEESEFLSYYPEYAGGVAAIKQKMSDVNKACLLAYLFVAKLPGDWHTLPRKEVYDRVSAIFPDYAVGYAMKCYEQFITPEEYTRNFTIPRWMRIFERNAK